MGPRSELVSKIQDDLDGIRERLETLTTEMSELGTELQGGFDRNDRVSALAGDMHFMAGEISGEFQGASHNWKRELDEIMEALVAAGE